MDEDGGKLLVVTSSLEEDFGGFVELGLEASLSNLGDVGLIWIRDEGLEFSHILVAAFGIGKDELGVDNFLFEGLSGHSQESDEFLEALLGLSDVDDHHVHGRILSLDETLDSLSEHLLLELSLTEFGPGLWLVHLLSEFLSALKVLFLVDEDLHGLDSLSELLVDAEGLVIELIFIFLSNSGEFLSVVVVKSVDVVHDSRLISLDCSKDKQVLKILVVGES